MNESPSPDEIQEITFFESLVYDLFKRGIVVIFIEGRRDSGKTNLAHLIMEIVDKFHLAKHFASNEKMISSYIPIDYIDSLEEVRSWAQHVQGTKLFILDEAGKAMPRRSPMNKLNVQLLQNFQTLRHSDLNLIFICPDEKYIDSASLGTDVIDVRIIKKFRLSDGKPNRKIALWVDLLTNRAVTITGLESTTLEYNDKWDCIFNLKGAVSTPKFSDKHQEWLWEWSHGKTYKELGIHHMLLNRITRKFIKEALEEKLHTAQ